MFTYVDFLLLRPRSRVRRVRFSRGAREGQGERGEVLRRRRRARVAGQEPRGAGTLRPEIFQGMTLRINVAVRHTDRISRCGLGRPHDPRVDDVPQVSQQEHLPAVDGGLGEAADEGQLQPGDRILRVLQAPAAQAAPGGYSIEAIQPVIRDHAYVIKRAN